MDLKELIKTLVRKELEEDAGGGSTTGGSGASSMSGGPGMNYATPAAFAKKGQKSNRATKEAEKMGWKKAKEGMPSDSKVKDYKSLWGKKKTYKIYENEDTQVLSKAVKIALEKLNMETNYLYEKPSNEWDEYDISNAKAILNKFRKLRKESNYDKASPSQNPSPYTQASGYTGVGGDDHESTYYDKRMKESIQDIIKQELLNEVTYKQFKTEVKYRTKAEQLHKAMREVKKKLSEIDRIVEYTQRMKQELSEGEGLKYWGRTEKAVGQISEMVNHLNNKIKNLHQ